MPNPYPLSKTKINVIRSKNNLTMLFKEMENQNKLSNRLNNRRYPKIYFERNENEVKLSAYDDKGIMGSKYSVSGKDFVLKKVIGTQSS